jgi:3-dehydroquinate synthase
VADIVRIPVAPPDAAAYDVVVGSDVLGCVGPLCDGALRVAVISPPAVTSVADALSAALAGAGHRVTRIPVPDGEGAKELAHAEAAWEALGAAGFTRTDAVVGVGGGACTDLAGFVAATWLRGVRLVQVPTTTAGMVDAAIGGKTAINTRAGKNLVGAFHQPAGVVCDLDTLVTLPLPDHRAGLAEVVKTGFIADPALLDLIEADSAEALRVDGKLTRELVERSVRVKAEVVSADPREAGRREILNYGHTLGHAIERREAYRWRHGDAVSVGLVYAAALGHATGRLDEATLVRHRQILEALGLPTTYPSAAWPELLDAMRVDKKARADRLRFVVLDGVAQPGVLDDPSAELLERAYAEVAA